MATVPAAGLAQTAPPAATPATQPQVQPQSGANQAGATSLAPAATPATAPAPDLPEADAPAAAPQAAAAPQEDEIVVTGFRRALLNATRAKENAVAFTDTIFAEDVGKFPDLNLAESLQRVPGVQLTRDSITGEGVQVAIRALPPSFTNVTIGGNRIQVASAGQIENQTTGREVDLDLFPSELFSRIDVSKTPSADQPEGGIAGSVNLSNARPFDNKGDGYVAGTIASGYGTLSHRLSPRGSLVASKTWGTVGALVGIALNQTRSRTDGWESIGWSNANLACAGCDNSRGNNFTFATVVPANAGNGLVTGSPVNLAALNPDVTTNQLTNALLPRLGRPMYLSDNRKRGTAVVALEWRPGDTLHFALDGIYGKSKRHIDRFDMNWQVRNSAPGFNGGMVPIGVQVDANNVVTAGTFANSSFFLEARTFDETLTYKSLSPSMTWNVTSRLKFDAQLSGNDSSDFLVRPTFNLRTPFAAGITVQYLNDPGRDIPTITPSVDLGNPNLRWELQNVQLSQVRRTTRTRSAQANLTWDVGDLQLKAGGSFDKVARSIVAYDNTAAFTAAFLAGVPNATLSQYLAPNGVRDYFGSVDGKLSYGNYVFADIDRLKAASNFAALSKNAPLATPATAAITPGTVAEKYTAGYALVSGDVDVFARSLRFNIGGRYIHTQQATAGPVLINGNLLTLSADRSYNNFLPSANAVYKLRDTINLRVAASRTISRPNPNDLLPGVSFIDPSAQTANAGNPQLRPFTSDNVDIGGEWYTGGLGYVGVALFHKTAKNFTSPTQVTRVFSDLGIPFGSVSAIQQAAILAAGGPDAAQVFVNTQTNSGSPLKFNGVEVTWVQPLDFAIKGLGFSAVFTRIETSGSANLATGVPPKSANVTGFYEVGGFSVHASYAYADRRSILPAPQNGLPLGIFIEPRGQVDLSASYELNLFGIDNKLLLNVVNLTAEPIKQTFGFRNATYSIYHPGTQVSLGVQFKF